MKLTTAVLTFMGLIVLFTSVADGSFGLKLEFCFNEELGEEVICGTYEVMENRNVRKGAKIRLNFIILPARTPNPLPDPVFVFDGGPGVGAASSSYSWARYCHKVREEREVVLLDQRGTGQSNPLYCQRIGNPESAQTYLQDMFPEDYVKECKKNLQKTANLRYYHSPMAMADVDDLREVLGYDHINIMGGSYGSYAGILYMKMYPERVRSAFLFSIALPHLLYPANLAQDTQAALDRLFADCAAGPESAADYPGLAAKLDQVLFSLQQGPVTVNIINPINEQPETVIFTHNNFIHGLRSMLYSNSRSRWIPAFIHWAAGGHFSPIAEYTASYLYWINQDIMDGMLLSVTCSETIPYIDFVAARAQAQGTMMGTYRLDQQQKACDLWVKGDLPDGFHDLVELDIPTLMVNGENDPTTPPLNGQILSQYLEHSALVIIPDAGHEIGVVLDGCLDELIARFYAQASVSDLDFSCVYTHTRPPFVSWKDYSDQAGDRIRRDFNEKQKALRGDPIKSHPKKKK